MEKEALDLFHNGPISSPIPNFTLIAKQNISPFLGNKRV